MNAETRIVNVALVLADDVVEERTGLQAVFDAVNARLTDLEINLMFKVLEWIQEGEARDFPAESPHALLTEISHNPSLDLIIAVYRTHFGKDISIKAVTSESKEYLKQQGRTLVFLCENAGNGIGLHSFSEGFRAEGGQGETWFCYKRKSHEGQRAGSKHLSTQIDTSLMKFARKWHQEVQATQRSSEVTSSLTLPDGWQFITPVFLDEQRAHLGGGEAVSALEAQRYFDGVRLALTWRIALAANISQREKVGDIVNSINQGVDSLQSQVILVEGASGEGKSTAILQAITTLVQTKSRVSVVWRRDAKAPLEWRLIEELLRVEQPIVIAIDDAEQITTDVYNYVQRIGSRDCKLQFVLSCSDTEMFWAKSPTYSMWRGLIGESFVVHRIASITEKEARNIVKSWSDTNALGTFGLTTANDGSRQFFAMAKEEYRNPKGGSLLGAVLEARVGRIALESRIDNLIERLSQRSALKGHTLRECFALIVALHSEGGYVLTKQVLKSALSCTLEQLQDEVIEPLGSEAAIADDSYLVLARHRKIAELSKKALSRSFDFERDVYKRLVTSALECSRKGDICRDELKLWQQLPKTLFIERKQTKAALAVSKVLADAEPSDPFHVTDWAYILRKSGKAGEAATLFRERYVHLKDKADKGFYFQWAVSEGQAGNLYMGTSLAAIALSDISREREDRVEPPMLRLSGLASSLMELFIKARESKNVKYYNTVNAEIFRLASLGAAVLGLSPKALSGNRGSFDVSRAQGNLLAAQQGCSTSKDVGLPLTEAFTNLQAGIFLALQLYPTEAQLPYKLVENSSLPFGRLQRLYNL